MEFPVIKEHIYVYGRNKGNHIVVEFTNLQEGIVIESTNPETPVGYYSNSWTPCDNPLWNDVTPKINFSLPDELFEVE